MNLECYAKLLCDRTDLMTSHDSIVDNLDRIVRFLGAGKVLDLTKPHHCRNFFVSYLL